MNIGGDMTPYLLLACSSPIVLIKDDVMNLPHVTQILTGWLSANDFIQSQYSLF